MENFKCTLEQMTSTKLVKLANGRMNLTCPITILTHAQNLQEVLENSFPKTETRLASGELNVKILFFEK